MLLSILFLLSYNKDDEIFFYLIEIYKKTYKFNVNDLSEFSINTSFKSKKISVGLMYITTIKNVVKR